MTKLIWMQKKIMFCNSPSIKLHYLLIFKECLVMHFFTIVGFFSWSNVTVWWDIVVSCFFPCLRKWLKKGTKHCLVNAHEQRSWILKDIYVGGHKVVSTIPLPIGGIFLKKKHCQTLMWWSMINHWCFITSWFKESCFSWFS